MEDNKKGIVWQFIQGKFFPKWMIIFDVCASFLRKFNSRSFWSCGAQEIHWQWSECLLNKMRCAQTQVLRDIVCIGEAILATLINKSQHFGDLQE